MGPMRSLRAQPQARPSIGLKLKRCTPGAHLKAVNPSVSCSSLSNGAETLSPAVASGTGQASPHPTLCPLPLSRHLCGNNPLYSFVFMSPSEPLPRAVSITEVEMVLAQAMNILKCINKLFV